MKIGLVQNKPEFGEVKKNLRKAQELLDGRFADLWIFPELAFTGYQFRDIQELETLSETSGGPTVRALQAMAALCGATLVAGLAERADGKIYNSAVMVDESGLIGLYRKVHLFDREKTLFQPGDLGFPVFRTKAAVVGMMICFDWLFPEAARSLALAGAQVIAHPSNLVLPYCQDAVVTRALENHVFVATANRVGSENRLSDVPLLFTGNSRMVAPDGSVLLDGPPDEPGLFLAEIDPVRADNKKVTARNDVIADRRPTQYRS